MDTNNATTQDPNVPAGLDSTAFYLSKAIKKAETGDYKDPYNTKGASGEYGAYQYTPDTWKAQAGKYLGNPNAPMTEDNQNKVMYTNTKYLLDQGYTQGQIASIHNSGKPDPTATGSGVNSYGVHYDVPAYVEKVKQNYLSYGSQPKSGGFNPNPYSNPSGGNNPGEFDFTGGGNTNANTPNAQPEGLGGKALDVAKGVGNFLFPIVGDVYHDIKGDSKKTFLQQAGDTALSALPFIPGLGEAGEAARGTEAAVESGEAVAKSGLLSKLTGSAVAKGAGVGYGAGVASNLSQGKGLGESFLPNANTIGGAVLGGVTPMALKGLGNLATKVSGIDPQILTELKNLGSEGNPEDVKLYNKFITATKEHATNLRATSPLSMAADSLDEAAGKVSKITDEAGKAVGEAKKAGANIPIAQPDVANVGKNFAQQVSEKYGLNLVSDEAGKVTATPIEGNMRQVDPSDISRIEKVATQLNQLYANGENATVKHATDIIANLNDLVDHSKDDLYGHTNDPLSGLLKSTAGDLNTAVRKGSTALADANDRFSGLKDLQGEISSMAGKNLNKGELLMRRVFSGDKSGDVQDLFAKIKAETGIDLTKNAVLAKHAIESYGSRADKTLLQQAIEGGTALHSGGTLPFLANTVQGIAKRTFANPEKIGRNLVQGNSGGLLGNLITKGAIELGSRSAKP